MKQIARAKAHQFIDAVIHTPAWSDEEFRLVDVGVSGGINQRWRVYGERLSAVGFDPLLAEVSRLTSIETQPRVTYEAALVTSPGLDPAYPSTERCVQSYPRCSAVAAHALRQYNYTQETFNAGAPVELTAHRISLDQRFADTRGPDFLKIDTDGWDFPVLLGAEMLLARDVLGVEVEVQFHGAVKPHSNTFANIDQFLRARGFSLFDLTTHRYSRAALPAPFVSDIAAQTISGQVSWGDAVYLRDLAHPGYDQMFAYPQTLMAALKLSTLFVLFDLPDCAAELLTTHPLLAAVPECVALLDLLTPDGYSSYEEFMTTFRTEPESLYRSRLHTRRTVDNQAPKLQSPADTPGKEARRKSNRGLPELKDRIHELKGERDMLRERCRTLEALVSDQQSRSRGTISRLFRRGSKS